MEVPEIKPCPFCGGKANLIQHFFIIGSYLKCSNCECSSSDRETEAAAIALWNRRELDWSNPDQPSNDPECGLGVAAAAARRSGAPK